MAFRDRIEVVIDFVTGGAKTGLAGIRAEVSQAEGAIGKMKAAGKGTMDYLGVAGPQVAMALGAAFVGFAAKGVTAFNDLALAAGRAAESTGLSVEEWSRLDEVAKDLGITSDQLEGSLKRTNLAASNGSLERWGIQIAKTKDGAYDAIGTYLNAIETIGQMSSAADRQAAAQQILGRSWSELAELTTMSSEEIRAAMAAVSEQKVIDDAEVRKAREMREAIDKAKDSIEDLSLAIGESLTPIITDGVNQMMDMKGVVEDIDRATRGGFLEGLRDGVEQTFNPLGFMRDKLDDAQRAWNQVRRGDFGPLQDEAERTGGKLDGLRESLVKVATEGRTVEERAENHAEAQKHAADAAEYYTSRMEAAKEGTAEFSEEAETSRDKLDELGDAWDRFTKKLDTEDLTADIEQGFGDLKQAGIDAYSAAEQGADDAQVKAREYEQALRDQKRRVAEYGEEVLGLPPKALTDVMALIDRGKLAEAERLLNEVARERFARITASVNGTFDGGVYDSGGGSGSRQGAPMGDRGAAPAVMAASPEWASAVAAWVGARDAAPEQKGPNRREQFAQEFERLRRRYELGDFTAADYLQLLIALRKKYSFARTSDPAMQLFREIQQAREDARQAARDAVEADQDVSLTVKPKGTMTDSDGNPVTTKGRSGDMPRNQRRTSPAGGGGGSDRPIEVHVHVPDGTLMFDGRAMEKSIVAVAPMMRTALRDLRRGD